MIFLNLYYPSLFSSMSCASGKNTLQNLFKNKSFLYKCVPPSQPGLSCSADINGASHRLSPKALVLSSSFHSFPPSLKDLSCLSPEPTYTSFAHNLGLTVPFADGNSFSFSFPLCNMLSRNWSLNAPYFVPSIQSPARTACLCSPALLKPSPITTAVSQPRTVLAGTSESLAC